MAGARWLKLENWAEERNKIDKEIPTPSGKREMGKGVILA